MRIGLLALVAGGVAAAPLDTYTRQPGVDALHYTSRLALRDSTDDIEGEAGVELRFVKDGVADFWLDLSSVAEGKGMVVAGVTAAGAPVRYTHQADRLRMSLAPAPKAGERRQFTIR